MYKIHEFIKNRDMLKNKLLKSRTFFSVRKKIIKYYIIFEL